MTTVLVFLISLNIRNARESQPPCTTISSPWVQTQGAGDEIMRMVCVNENVANDSIILPPNGQHCKELEIKMEATSRGGEGSNVIDMFRHTRLAIVVLAFIVVVCIVATEVSSSSESSRIDNMRSFRCSPIDTMCALETSDLDHAFVVQPEHRANSTNISFAGRGGNWLSNVAMDTFSIAIVCSNYYEQLVLGNRANNFGSNHASTTSMDASMVPEMIPTIVELAHGYKPSIIQHAENKVSPTACECPSTEYT
jgi:hypothetical protein